MAYKVDDIKGFEEVEDILAYQGIPRVAQTNLLEWLRCLFQVHRRLHNKVKRLEEALALIKE